MLPSVQLVSSTQPVSHCFADVDWLWMGRQIPLGILRVVHGPFAWRYVVLVLIPIPDVFELYPWELGVVELCTGVGLFGT